MLPTAPFNAKSMWVEEIDSGRIKLIPTAAVMVPSPLHMTHGNISFAVPATTGFLYGGPPMALSAFQPMQLLQSSYGFPTPTARYESSKLRKEYACNFYKQHGFKASSMVYRPQLGNALNCTCTKCERQRQLNKYQMKYREMERARIQKWWKDREARKKLMDRSFQLEMQKGIIGMRRNDEKQATPFATHKHQLNCGCIKRQREPNNCQMEILSEPLRILKNIEKKVAAMSHEELMR